MTRLEDKRNLAVDCMKHCPVNPLFSSRSNIAHIMALDAQMQVLCFAADMHCCHAVCCFSMASKLMQSGEQQTNARQCEQLGREVHMRGPSSACFTQTCKNLAPPSVSSNFLILPSSHKCACNSSGTQARGTGRPCACP